MEESFGSHYIFFFIECYTEGKSDYICCSLVSLYIGDKIIFDKKKFFFRSVSREIALYARKY